MTNRLKQIIKKSSLGPIAKKVQDRICSSRAVNRDLRANSALDTTLFAANSRKPIVHASYHKMGSMWVAKVLQAVSKTYGLSFRQVNEAQELDPNCDISAVNHSDIIQGLELDIRGSHMVRDLRDVVVSGYFYHLWTDEAWAHVPNARFNGVGYQEHLRSLDQDHGLLAEIQFLSRYAHSRKIWEWDFTDSGYLEIKYEDLFADQENGFRRLFTHYGFTPEAVDKPEGLTTDFTDRHG